MEHHNIDTKCNTVVFSIKVIYVLLCTSRPNKHEFPSKQYFGKS